MMSSIGVGRACGKFGELLQGALPGDNNNFLISVPINRYSTAKFQCSKIDKVTEIYPTYKSKSVMLAFEMMKYFEYSCGWKLELESNIVESKGLGSSTADLVATALAIEKKIGKMLPIEILLSFLKNIEPSDGIMYEGLACFYHRKVELHSQLGFFPNFTIAAIDEGGIIDTIDFNKSIKPYSTSQKQYYASLLENICLAIKGNNLRTIGEISTQSAILHQEVNPKKHLEFLIEISKDINAYGIITTHSGTYLGIILDSLAPDYLSQINFIDKKVSERALRLEIFTTTIDVPLKATIENV